MDADRRASLLRDLAGVAPADARERGHLERMRELAEGRADPFDASRVAPGHFTASAFVVEATATRVLLIHHAKLRRWLQPGGHVEVGDQDLLDAALREVREETGARALSPLLDAPFDVDVHTIPARGALGAHEHFDVRYLLEARSGEVSAGDGVLDCRWVPVDDLVASAEDESVARAVRKIAQLRASGRLGAR
ncbi:MAG: NUDIX hydrolase [Deltaproteobacteria bacterium]|nr:NUDIX hydrolase [Deltaproteobacteria bacterium]